MYALIERTDFRNNPRSTDLTGDLMRRRHLLHSALIAWPLSAWTLDAKSQDAFPNRPMRIVVGFAPGGGVDLIARPFAERLQGVLGQPVAVDNRPGANGNLAATHVSAGSPPDGYTLILVNNGMATISPHLYKEGVPDFRKDLVPVGGVTGGPQCVIVPASLGIGTLKQLVELARNRPGYLNCASGGNGTLAHLALELLKRDQHLDIVHVPFKGTGPAVPELMAGRIHMMIDSLNQVKGRSTPACSASWR